ncbi:MAG: MFS transporter [Gammaproteobacteria bacterium]|nr:MFS transporter [Gammaproteobacteria bacterium]
MQTGSRPVHEGAEALFRKIGWRLLPILMLCYLLAYIDRQNVGFAKLEFMRDLGFGEAVFGLGGGLFYLGYSLFEVPSNLMLRRIGARATLLRIMLAWGICASLFAFMHTALHYYSLRFLLGVAEAGFFPGVLLYISFWIPPSRRAGFTAMFMAAMPLSGLIGSPVSGAIMQLTDGLWEMAGWQWMFILEGVPSVAMALVVYFVLADVPAKAKWLSPAEKSVLQAELDAEESQKQGKVPVHFREVLMNPRFYGLAAMSISLLACIAGLQLWLPSVIRAAGVNDLVHLGMYAAVPSLVAVAAQQFNARHSDRTMERRWHAAIPMLVAGAGFLVLPLLNGNLVASMLVLCLVSSGLLGATGPYWTLPSSMLAGSAAAGGIALVTTIGGLGAFVSSSVVGSINEWVGVGYAGLWFYSALAILGPVVMLASTQRTAGGKNG